MSVKVIDDFERIAIREIDKEPDGKQWKLPRLLVVLKVSSAIAAIYVVRRLQIEKVIHLKITKCWRTLGSFPQSQTFIGDYIFHALIEQRHGTICR